MIAPSLRRRHVSRRFVVLTWLIAVLVAAAVSGLWVFGGSDGAQAPVMHIGPPAGAADVTTVRTTFRDLTDPEHPRIWTLERSYRTRAVDVPATVAPR
jgi:hypothetical protein